MQDPIAIARVRAVPHLRRALLRGWPRLAVSGMLALTGLAGFLCSFGLLRLGVDGMGARYAISVLVAYAAFLAQLRLWVALARRRGPGSDPSSALDGVTDLGDLPGLELPARWVGAGGRFAGGGASGAFSPPPSAVAPGGAPELGAGASKAAGGLGIDLDLDLDGWQVLAIAVLVLLVACGAIAAGYVVWSAPTLLAEVFFDGVVAGVLYRRLRRGSARAWWQGALSRTWVPALVLLLFFGFGGLVLEHAVPGARSIGDVVRAVADRR